MRADQRERPLASSNFRVEFGAGASSGFAEVVFPRFAVDAGADAAPDAAGASAAAASSKHLLLRRGATGALDLYAWWDQARRGRAPARRVVRVKLLAEDHATVVMTWRFRNVRPVGLTYSPLNALAGAVLMETLELAFDEVEIS
jgi:phage tail-like protein